MSWEIRLPEGDSTALRLAGDMLGEGLSSYKDEASEAASLRGVIDCRIESDRGFAREEYEIDIHREGGGQTVVIAAANEIGLLYGVSDFVNIHLPDAARSHTWMNPYYFVNPLITGFSPRVIRSSPKVKRRGLWTWGYVIYDYRGYLQNMARLKLNEIVIWNDFVPLNAEEIVSYAHSLGIRVIWGYAWGWDNHFDIDLSDTAMLNRLSDQAVECFKRDYLHLPGDGIYFQSFTETTEEMCSGRIIAEVVVDWVNAICDQILSIKPDIELQFGLHATSVQNQLKYISRVDPRVRIVWEDCGAFPYAYLPENVANAGETLAFTSKMLRARRSCASGVVTKGMICLDWTDFIHRTKAERIGEADEERMKSRLPMVRRVMRMVQSYWMINGNKLLETVRQIMREDEDCQILALLEDGLFEKNIWLPSAMFAQALWDCDMDFESLMAQTAQRPDVTFANLDG